MSQSSVKPQTSTLARTLEVLTTLGIAMMLIAIVATLAGYNGFGLTNNRLADQSAMSVSVEPIPIADFNSPFEWVESPNGTVEASSGRPYVEFSGPIEAQLSFYSPTGRERVVFALWSILGPALTAAGLWQVRGMARSTRKGDPFTKANENRLWRLALLTAVGGTAYVVIGEMVRAWLVGRSAASDAVEVSATFSFLPLVIGIAIAALASIWRVGVDLRQESLGTV